MGMGTRLYSLPSGDGDGTKVWYLLGLGMGIKMNFFYGGENGITKLVPAPPRPVAIPTGHKQGCQLVGMTTGRVGYK